MRHQPRDPHDRDDLGVTHTDADTPSETRFGIRPVPEGHRQKAGPSESRSIPPSGDVSPDGRHAYPRPSGTAKWLALGGMGLAAAALTAGTVLVGRQIADQFGVGSAPPKPKPAARPDASAPRPRMQDAKPATQPPSQAMRFSDDGGRPRDPGSMKPRPASDSFDAARKRPAPKPRRKNLMAEIETNSQSLTNGLDNLVRSVSSAMLGFRTVAGQATDIVREFGAAADLVRGFMATPGAENAPRPAPRHRAENPRDDRDRDADRRERRMSDLNEDDMSDEPLDYETASAAAERDARTHRL